MLRLLIHKVSTIHHYDDFKVKLMSMLNIIYSRCHRHCLFSFQPDTRDVTSRPLLTKYLSVGQNTLAEQLLRSWLTHFVKL